MKVKCVLASIFLLASSAYASGPGSTVTYISEIRSFESNSDEFRIFARTSNTRNIEISGPMNDYTKNVLSNIISPMFGESETSRVWVRLDTTFTNSGGIRVESDRTQTGLIGGATITKAFIVKSVPFNRNAAASIPGVKSDVSLVGLYPNNLYLIRTTDIKGNYIQYFGNTSDKIGNECVARTSQALAANHVPLDIGIAGDIRSSSGTASSNLNVRSTTTHTLRSMDLCSIEKGTFEVASSAFQ